MPEEYQYLLGQEKEMNEESIKKIIEKMKIPGKERQLFQEKAIKVFNLSNKINKMLKQHYKKVGPHLVQQKTVGERKLAKMRLKNKDGSERKGRVEPGLEVFKGERRIIDLKAFVDDYRSLGMDLTKGVYFIDYHADTNELIKELFKEQEPIHANAVSQYLSMGNKLINQFNNSLDEYIVPSMQMKGENQEYYSLMEKARNESDFRKKSKLLDRAALVKGLLN